MQRTTKSYQCHPWRWMLPVFVFLCCDKSLAINIDVAFADVSSDSKIVLVNAKDLTEINVSVQVGDDYTGTVQIRVEEPSSGGPRIKLWPDPLKTGQELPKSWEVPITNGVLQPVEGTKPVKFWVEGIKESATTDDVVIKATLSNGDVDEVKLTLLPVEVEQQNYSSTQGIRFCRWLDAFQGVSFDNEFADKDRDRFRIRIPGIIPNLTKIKIKSTNIQGAVIGGAWLGKTSDGDYEVEMKQENGAMVSTWILLVSDGDDDVNYNGKGTDDGKDDQTLLADFDSKIIVSLPEFSNAQFEFSAQKPVGVLKIHPVYLSPAGDLPFDKMEAISLHIGKMKEIYRQIGVRVDTTASLGEAVPQAWFDPVSATGEVADHLNGSECQAARNKVSSLQVPEKTIRIGYVDAVMAPDEPISSTTAFGYTVLGTDGILVSLEAQQARDVLGVSAHEVGHALDLDHVAPQHLLMKSPLFWQNGKRDSKRFEEGDFDKIKTKTAFYVPVP